MCNQFWRLHRSALQQRRAPWHRPAVSSPKELREEADRLERQAQNLLGQAEALRAAADKIEALSSGTNHALIALMESSAINADTKKFRPGVRLRSKGPVAKVAKALGVSLAEVARRLKVSDTTVRSWDARNNVPDDQRPALVRLLEEHQAEQAKKKSSR